MKRRYIIFVLLIQSIMTSVIKKSVLKIKLMWLVYSRIWEIRRKETAY